MINIYYFCWYVYCLIYLLTEIKLQLIEIVQLTLLIFIVASTIIFLISYLGYRRNSKANEFYEIKKDVLIEADKEIKIDDFTAEQKQIIRPREIVRKTPRFKVFTPSSNDDPIKKKENSDKSKSHNPRTIVLKK